MEAQQLTIKLAELRPDLPTAELLRLALLLALQNPDLRILENAGELERQCQETGLQLTATSDQHAAVADEIDALAATAPCDFSPSHLWTLVRAIKVQNQIINLYLGPCAAQSSR